MGASEDAPCKDSSRATLGSSSEEVQSACRAAYAQHVRQVMDAAGWLWPEHVLLDPRKQPRFVTTVDEFLHELKHGSHMDEIVVFPDGLQKLGQDASVPPDVREAMGLTDAAGSADVQSAYDVLERLAAAGSLEERKGKITFRRHGCPKEEPADKWGNSVLQPKWDALRAKAESGDVNVNRDSVYIAEMRRAKPEKVEQVIGGFLPDRRKSSLGRTMRERVFELGLDAKDLLYWDDYSEGFFIGGHSAGYRFHVDCMQTSNVGSLYAGHKLMGIWSYPDDTKAAIGEFYDTLFVPPLPESKTRALEQACKVVLAPPGCVYIFSGCNAHVVCNIGYRAPLPDGTVPRGVVAASYEAFSGLNLRHVTALAGTNTDMHAEECWLDEEDLEDFETDVVENMRCMSQRVLDGVVKDKQPLVSALTCIRSSSARFEKLWQNVVAQSPAVVALKDEEKSSSPSTPTTGCSEEEKRSGSEEQKRSSEDSPKADMYCSFEEKRSGSPGDGLKRSCSPGSRAEDESQKRKRAAADPLPTTTYQ